MSKPHYIIRAGEAGDVGAKARGLAELARFATVPPWFVVSSRTHADGIDLRSLPELGSALAELAPNGERVAVRSSASEEDGAYAAFAGQFESYLSVALDDVPARIIDVWRSASLARLGAYREARGVERVSSVPSVIVQQMVNADRAGVAFSADPVDGRRSVVVIAATHGLGSSLVSGDENADTYRVNRAGTIIERSLGDKRLAQRATDGGVKNVELAGDARSVSTLNDADVLRIAALARAAALQSGAPQDIEWAIQDDVLYALQTRPITSLSALPDPDAPLIVWDNSNIAESYSGVTTPLTFTFARSVYEEVYREFCHLIGVPESRIAANGDAFRNMLGLVRGRIYYNLASWYQTLALLPGFAINRRFMEQMMGVTEPLPDEIVARALAASRRGGVSDALAALRTVGMLLGRYARINSMIGQFYVRVDQALESSAPISVMRADELVAHYRALEASLLYHWDAPLLNDFFAMIFFGLLGRLCERWCGDASLQNELVRGQAVISIEPVRRMRVMARAATDDQELVGALVTKPPDDAVRAIRARPAFAKLYQAYLDDFGDRCAGELKLETETLDARPEPLIRAIGTLALRGDDIEELGGDGASAVAEKNARRLIGARPIRRAVFSFVLRHARCRVRDRENLRFERTRVFGRVRRIMLELGRRFTEAGLLCTPRDVFYLTIDDVLGAADATTASADFKAIVVARRQEFTSYRGATAPPDRFETRGLIPAGPDLSGLTTSRADDSKEPIPAALDGDTRQGIACYPGVIRGIARVVHDPTAAALQHGEILVAERTDPGWVILFPSAAALVVERGSLLSHSAIVARELRLPAVVSIEGLTAWLHTGDLIQVDGATGTVRRLERQADASKE